MDNAAGVATEKPAGGSLTRQAVKLAAAKTLAFLLTLAMPLVIVRRLNQFEFGEYKQAFLVIATATVVLPMGFGMSLYYFLPRFPEQRRTVVFQILLFLLVVGCLAWIVLAL